MKRIKNHDHQHWRNDNFNYMIALEKIAELMNNPG